MSSSRSYRAEGWWQKCLDAKPDFLLIQFGHNDQPGKGPERESAANSAFRDHLRAFNAVPEAAGLFSDEAISAAEVPQAYSTSLSHGELQLDETESAVTIRQSGKLILAYNKLSPPVPNEIDPVYQRSGFLHPVASPAGRVVTETFPFDHPHQHGIFTAWVKTTWHDREIDFWNLAGGTGRVLHQRIITTFAEDGRIGFETDLTHRAEKEPVVDILRERWRITAFATDGSYHGFDLQTTQHALTDEPLVIQKYHYGGVALRGPVRWLTAKDSDSRKQADGLSNASVREPSEFLNDLGSDRIKGNHEHARWVSLSGQNDGQPVTITVLCHRDNFRAPQAARLHPTKPYFVFCSWQTRFPPTRGRWGTTDDIDSRKSWGCGRSLRHEN